MDSNLKEAIQSLFSTYWFLKMLTYYFGTTRWSKKQNRSYEASWPIYFFIILVQIKNIVISFVYFNVGQPQVINRQTLFLSVLLVYHSFKLKYTLFTYLFKIHMLNSFKNLFRWFHLTYKIITVIKRISNNINLYFSFFFLVK